MKVQIVQLDPHDDLASVSDKLAWAQAPRVVLVWPDRARLLRRRLDLVLLRRNASGRGIQLGIVTRDPVVLEQAAALGIPLFRSRTRLPEEGWGQAPSPPGTIPPRPTLRPERVPPPLRPERELPRLMRVGLMLVVSLVLLGTAAVLVPHATITLSPTRADERVDLRLTLDPRLNSTNSEGSIPARSITRTASGSLRITTTGTARVPTKPASGPVVFANQTDQPVLIPAGTGVLPAGRPDLRFVTASDVSLGAGAGNTAEVVVTAFVPGSAGNLPAGSLNAIDGPLGLRASVSQPAAMAGGAEAERPAVAAADQATALRLLTDQLLAQAASAMAAGVDADESLAPDSVRVVNTPATRFDRPVGAPGDSVGLDLTLEFAALVYHPADLEAAIDRMLAERRAAGRAPIPGSRSWTLGRQAELLPDSLQLHVFEQSFVPLDLDHVRRAARGQARSSVVTRLASIGPLASPPQVVARPAWWPVLPWLDVRIAVRYEWEAP